MSTKFVSKNSNYMIVLKPGMEGSRVLGTSSTPGLYVKFQAGIVDVKEEAIVEMLRNHPSYGIDFQEIKQEEIDPFLSTRNDPEPDHVLIDMNYGHAEKRQGSTKPSVMSPALKKYIEGEALKMLPTFLKENPDILKAAMESVMSEMKSAPTKEEAPEAEVEADLEAEVEAKVEAEVKAKPVAPKAKGK